MPQNQKTDALPDITPDDLPDLTEKQMAFVIGICEGMTLIDAYKSAGYAHEGWTKEAAQVAASKVRANGNVSVWISTLRRQQFSRAAYTKDAHLAELDSLIEEAKASGNYGAAVNACKAKGQVEGHYVSLHEDITKRSKSKAQLIEQVAKDLGQDAADTLAGKLGVERLVRAENKLGMTADPKVKTA